MKSFFFFKTLPCNPKNSATFQFKSIKTVPCISETICNSGSKIWAFLLTKMRNIKILMNLGRNHENGLQPIALPNYIKFIKKPLAFPKRITLTKEV